MAVIGSVPNANGASLSGQVLTLQPCSGSFGGILTTGAQSIAGAKTLSNQLAISATTNQLRLGTTNTVTLTSPAPAASRTYTIPETGANSSFVMTDLAQSINGAKTLSSQLAVSATTNQLRLGTTNTVTLTSPAPAASRTYTIPDTGANSSFVMTDLAQTMNGVKTFSSAVVIPGATVGTNATTTGLTLNNSTASYVPTVLNYYEEFSTTFTFNDSGTNISLASTLKLIRIGRKVTAQVFEMNGFTDSAPVRTSSITIDGVIPARFRTLSNFSVAVHTFIGTYGFGVAKFDTSGSITVWPRQDLTTT